MKTKHDIAGALKEVRKARGLTQEDFSVVSSRTYISMLERGLKSPTLDKIDDLAGVMEVHPITLLALAYASPGKMRDIDDICRLIRCELSKIADSQK
jgi:transcriptional regulator with XRE-family HTH domain